MLNKKELDMQRIHVELLWSLSGIRTYVDFWGGFVGFNNRLTL